MIVAQAVIFERVLGIAGTLDVLLDEGVLVDDERATRLEVAEVRLQRGGVHRHQNVGLVAGRQDVLVREVDLERGDPGERAGRRADLRREVGKRCEVVAEDRGCVGEALSGELHAVPGVACEADDYLMEFFNGLRFRCPFRSCPRKPPPDLITRRPRMLILRAFAPPP